MNTILNKYNWSIRTTPVKESIKAIEKMVGFKLPEDYKNFLLQYAGAKNFIGVEFVRLWDLNELIGDNEGYQIVKKLSNTIGYRKFF
jgi:hypothetical protein